ncbi:hypothetical protein [Persicobacter diffluens]|uniref:Uncharacterized protein n=1 Tax=Persicobacter diffluens TaxID=981 RepID=A0AAN5ALH1_9BACT|nr:hypothetical protein PEDI_45070 [Persicobacter diffluens]
MKNVSQAFALMLLSLSLYSCEEGWTEIAPPTTEDLLTDKTLVFPISKGTFSFSDIWNTMQDSTSGFELEAIEGNYQLSQESDFNFESIIDFENVQSERSGYFSAFDYDGRSLYAAYRLPLLSEDQTYIEQLGELEFAGGHLFIRLDHKDFKDLKGQITLGFDQPLVIPFSDFGDENQISIELKEQVIFGQEQESGIYLPVKMEVFANLQSIPHLFHPITISLHTQEIQVANLQAHFGNFERSFVQKIEKPVLEEGIALGAVSLALEMENSSELPLTFDLLLQSEEGSVQCSPDGPVQQGSWHDLLTQENSNLLPIINGAGEQIELICNLKVEGQGAGLLSFSRNDQVNMDMEVALPFSLKVEDLSYEFIQPLESLSLEEYNLDRAVILFSGYNSIPLGVELQIELLDEAKNVVGKLSPEDFWLVEQEQDSVRASVLIESEQLHLLQDASQMAFRMVFSSSKIQDDFVQLRDDQSMEINIGMIAETH